MREYKMNNDWNENDIPTFFNRQLIPFQSVFEWALEYLISGIGQDKFRENLAVVLNTSFRQGCLSCQENKNKNE